MTTEKQEQNPEKKIVEIGGVKMEIDLRSAKTIETYKVGDNVRVLVKHYSDEYKVYPGVIIGFDSFEKRPTISIAYLDITYSGVDIKFVYINADSKNEVEIAPAYEVEDIRFKESDVLTHFQNEISKHEEVIKDIEKKKSYFRHTFGKYFRPEMARK